MPDENREVLERKFPNGYSIYCWLDEDEGEPVVKFQWRHPNGKPVSRPVQFYLNSAKEDFEMLAAFAGGLRARGARSDSSGAAE